MPRSKTTHCPSESTGQGRLLDHLARKVVAAGAAPLAACVACKHSAGYWTWATGFASASENEPLADTTCVFDLASLTKPLFAVAVHAAMEFGKLDGQAPLAELVPELSGTWAERRTLDELLSHRAGLLAHVDLFKALQARCGRTRASLLRTAANSPLAGIERDARSFPPVYSDLGYILAGAAVEAQLGVRLDAWLARSVRDFTHGGVASIRQWLTEPVHPVHFAPTEVVPWRGGLLRGVVHDENAWLLSGYGLSGHAGLFGTALAVANFGMALLDSLAGRPSPIARAVTAKATARRPDSTLCSGFDRRADVGSSAGSYCSNETFGHLGFTGTSIWCDPERNAVAVLLTNRVCPSRDNLRIRELRPALHDALFRWADGDAR